jgi:hypothetical protein
MREQVKQLHNEMRAFLSRTYFDLKHLDALIHNLEKFNDEEIFDLLQFVNKLYREEYTELKKIWTLPHINDNMWHQYKLLKLKDFPEIELLHDAWDAFRQELKDFLKSRKRNANKNRKAKAIKRAEKLRRIAEQSGDISDSHGDRESRLFDSES